jgi:hypothetical protein
VTTDPRKKIMAANEKESAATPGMEQAMRKP